MWLTVMRSVGGLIEAEGPRGTTDTKSVILPVRPRLLTVTVEFAEVPATKLTELGVASIVKSP